MLPQWGSGYFPNGASGYSPNGAADTFPTGQRIMSRVERRSAVRRVTLARVRVLEAARHTERSAPGNLMGVDLHTPLCLS
jgi:hypothetical protein